MKRTGKCTKCGSTNIAIVKSGFTHTGNGNIINENIPVGFMKAAFVSHFVCCDCGFLEHWVEESNLKAVEARYKNNT